MIYSIIIVVVLASIVAVIFTRWITQIRQTANIISRLAPGLVELEPFLKLLSVLSDSSHAAERHGPLTTVAEQIERANTGKSPDGKKGSPVTSSRWVSHYSMLKAIEVCKVRWNNGKLPTHNCFELRFDKNIGQVVDLNSEDCNPTNAAKIVFNGSGDVVTAFLVYESSISNTVIHVDDSEIDKSSLDYKETINDS